MRSVARCCDDRDHLKKSVANRREETDLSFVIGKLAQQHASTNNNRGDDKNDADVSSPLDIVPHRGRDTAEKKIEQREIHARHQHEHDHDSVNQSTIKVP